MELNFTPWRVATLVALFAGYALGGGFVIPSPAASIKAWAATVGLFTLGAIQATVLDHHPGKTDRSSVRWFHVVTGIAVMALAATWRYRLGGG